MYIIHWARMYLGGDGCLQHLCGGFDPHRVHQDRSRITDACIAARGGCQNLREANPCREAKMRLSMYSLYLQRYKYRNLRTAEPTEGATISEMVA